MPPRKKISPRQQEANAVNAVAQWNQKYPHGALVSYEDIKGEGESVRCNTRGAAYVMCCEPVVFLEEWSGSVSIDHCTPIEALKPLVQRVELEDGGQDFSTWYIRDGFVIDCQPFQGDVWVGTQVMNQKNLGPNEQILLKSRSTGNTIPLRYKVQSIETLSREASAEVEAIGRKWAEMKGIYVDQLGLEPATADEAAE